MIDRLARQPTEGGAGPPGARSGSGALPIGIGRLASETGVDEHEARCSLRMLENDGHDELIERLSGLENAD